MNQTAILKILGPDQIRRVFQRMGALPHPNFMEEATVDWIQRGPVTKDHTAHDVGHDYTVAIVNFRGDYGVGFSKRNPNYNFTSSRTGLTIATMRALADLLIEPAEGLALEVEHFLEDTQADGYVDEIFVPLLQQISGGLR